MKRKTNIKSLLQHSIYYLIKYVPSKKMRHKLCLRVLQRRNSLPLYLGVFRGDIAVQVGTPNIVTVVRMSRLVGANGKVVIVEAEPSNAERLKYEASKKNLANVTIVSKGAWSSTCKIKLDKSDKFDGDHKIAVPNVSIDNDFRTDYGNQVEIEVDTLDNILSEIGVSQINYLSITVNGAEHEVLKGCAETLRSSSSIRVFSKGHARIGGAETGSPLNVPILKLLKHNGYSAMVTKGEKSTAGIDSWMYRDGDVFGWKTPSNLIAQC